MTPDTQVEILDVVLAIRAHIIGVVGSLFIIFICGGNNIFVILETVQVVRVLAHAIYDIVVAATVSLAISLLFEEETGVALSADALLGALRAEMGTLVAFVSR